MRTDAPLWDSLVFDGIDDVDVEAVTVAFNMVEVVARGRPKCPDCARFSDRVHDRYHRRLKNFRSLSRASESDLPSTSGGSRPSTGRWARSCR